MWMLRSALNQVYDIRTIDKLVNMLLERKEDSLNEWKNRLSKQFKMTK